MSSRLLHAISRGLLAALIVLLSACGSGESEAEFEPAAPPVSTRIQLGGDEGNPVVRGVSYDYSPANALITMSYRRPVEANGNKRHSLDFTVEAAESWSLYFDLPAGQQRITPGRYEVGTVFPDDGLVAVAHVARSARLLTMYRQCARAVDDTNPPTDWTMAYKGGGAGSSLGWFAVESVSYEDDGNTIASIAIRFELHCKIYPRFGPVEDSPKLRGLVHYVASDRTTLAGPATPPPGLWSPTLPLPPGNVLHLESEPGDPVGKGRTFTLQASDDTELHADGSAGSRNLRFGGTSPDSSWWAELKGMASLLQMQPGYYGDVRSPVSWHHEGGVNPVMRVQGLGGCDAGEDFLFALPYRGWFVIDSITYDDEFLTAIELRFEQRCEGATGALRGKLRWVRP